ncbi:MAG: GMP/IMP nucleotidase [Gammaproteobacteria bacterium]|nr:GMP/IMP nucleotidase [Gammaproteobacteria bacterium]
MNDNRSLDWAQIKTVFLDMDGTLMDLAFDNYFWHEYVPSIYSKNRGMNDLKAKQLLLDMYKRERGNLTWYCTDYWSEQLDLDIKQLKQQVASKVSLFPLVSEFLVWLQENGKRSVLLTNAHIDSVDIKMEQTSIRPMFDRVITSHSYGYAKEHDEFWPLLAEDEVYQRESTLLIDDNVSVLQAADRYGIKHLLSVLQPDTTLPIQDTKGFLAINGFHDIVDGLIKS